jgi:branched-chain amino acid transport system ATP-binding protein
MPALEVRGLSYSYGSAKVLDGVDFHVDEAEIVTLIGPNGAGKTTLLNVVARSLRLREGTVLLAGTDTRRHSQAEMVRQGCLLVPEGRQVFAALTVEDNLLLGRYVRRREGLASSHLARVYELFPRLWERSRQLAGTLSGGEQQMLAIGRAMMGEPRVMLLDEPSLGLSPQLVERIMGALSQLREQGVTIVLVEQNAFAALRLADRGYLLQTGRVVSSGSSAELSEDPTVRHVYLGAAKDEAPNEPRAASPRK